MEPQIRFCTSADGTRIGYAVYGPQNSPPLVAVPMWGKILDAYWAYPAGWRFTEVPARHRRCVEYDRRGGGASQRDVSDLSLAAQVDDLSAVADALHLERFDLVGWFDGSAIAASYAAQHPGRVSRLVLCSPFSVAAGTAWGNTAAQTARTIRADWSLARRAMATVFFPSDTADQRWWSRVMKDSVPPEAAARHYEEYIAPLDITSELPQVRAPTLVLNFSEMRMTALEESRAVATSLPDARFVSLEGDASRVLDRFEDLVLPFLDESRDKKAPQLPEGTAVILFADIVDSTALTERLGDAAFRDKARELDAALRTIIHENSGTPIEGKLLGDGVLAVFTSARQAIEAALACRKAGDDAGLPLHLGLHAGDVTREKDPYGRDNVYGGAVNIAARISGLSAPGEVLVSDTVRSLARTSAGVRFEDRGEQPLKGVGERVRVWAVVQ